MLPTITLFSKKKWIYLKPCAHLNFFSPWSYRRLPSRRPFFNLSTPIYFINFVELTKFAFKNHLEGSIGNVEWQKTLHTFQPSGHFIKNYLYLKFLTFNNTHQTFKIFQTITGTFPQLNYVCATPLLLKINCFYSLKTRKIKLAGDFATPFLFSSLLFLFKNSFKHWSYLSRFFDEVPLSFKSLSNLTISDNLMRTNSYLRTSTILNLNEKNYGNLSGFKIKKVKLNLRRIKTLWVSKVTQCTLTPARNHFLKFHSLKFLYQKKITKFIFNFYSFTSQNCFSFISTSFNVIFFCSGLVTSIAQFNWFIKNKLVFLNFKPLIVRPNSLVTLYLHFGDIINLLITPKLALIISFWDSGVFYLKRKFFKFLRKFRIRTSRKPPKTPSFRIPKWVDKIYFNHDSIYFLFETDLLTQTTYYLNSNNVSPIRLLPQRRRYLLPFSNTIRSLNWKSLT